MARPVLPTLEERAALVEDSRTGCTLDGKPAYVSGYRLEYAVVRQRDPKGGHLAVEFSWPTVAHILSTHRNFRS